MLARRIFGVTVCAVFLFVNVGVGANSHADDGWTIDQVLDVLKSRERAIRSIDAVIEEVTHPGPDWQRYGHAMNLYNSALAEFYHFEYEPKPPIDPKKVIWPEPSSFRYRRDSSGHNRVDWLKGPGGVDQQSPAPSTCFDGRVWQRSFRMTTTGKLHVTLDTFLGIRSFPLFLGIGSLRGFHQLPRDTGERGSLSEYLAEASSSKHLLPPEIITDSELGKCVRVVVLRSMEKEYPRARKPIYRRLTVLLDPSRGLAPVKVRSVELSKEGDDYVELSEGGSNVGTWSDLVEAVPGVWLARKFRVDSYFAICLPRTKRGFQPLLKDGKPVVWHDVVQIDESSMKSVKYQVSGPTFCVLKLEINKGFKKPFYRMKFPVGTIVQDNLTSEIFELTAASPAVDATVKRPLECDVPRRSETSEEPSNEEKPDTPAAAPPPLQFDHTHYEPDKPTFAVDNSWPIVVHAFPFVNSSDRTVRITRVRGGCSCLVDSYPKKPIPPGEKGEIQLSVDLRLRIGRFVTGAEVFVENEDASPIVLSVAAFVVHYPFVQPMSVDFGDVVVGKRDHRKIEVVVPLAAKEAFSGVKIGHRNESAEYKVGQGRIEDQYAGLGRAAVQEIECSLVGKRAGTDVTDLLTITVENRGSALSVPLQARIIHPSFTVQPPAVHFGPVTSKGLKRRVVVRPRSGTAPLKLSVEPDGSPDIRVWLEQSPDDPRETYVWIEAVPGKCRFLKSEIKVSTDKGSIPYLLQYVGYLNE